jgi:hypothetical protein
MGYYIKNKRTGVKTEVAGFRAFLVAVALIITVPILLVSTIFFAVVCPILALVAIIGGVVDMGIMGLNFWNGFWVLAGITFFCFYRLKKTITYEKSLLGLRL